MTILLTEIPTYVTYTAAAGQTYFTFPMPFWANSDITVVKNLVVLTQGSQYYVSGAQQQTGMSMSLVTPASNGDIITISRYVPYERVANYPLTGPMRIESINIEQAKHVAMMQQLRDGLRNHEQRLSLIEGGGGGGGGSGFATFYINDQPPRIPSSGWAGGNRTRARFTFITTMDPAIRSGSRSDRARTPPRSSAGPSSSAARRA